MTGMVDVTTDELRWLCLSEASMHARRVSSLDRSLGGFVSDVDGLLEVQGILLLRQYHARCAVAAWEDGLGLPSYLVDPIGSLGCWPNPYEQTPEVMR